MAIIIQFIICVGKSRMFWLEKALSLVFLIALNIIIIPEMFPLLTWVFFSMYTYMFSALQLFVEWLESNNHVHVPYKIQDRMISNGQSIFHCMKRAFY